MLAKEDKKQQSTLHLKKVSLLKYRETKTKKEEEQKPIKLKANIQ